RCSDADLILDIRWEADILVRAGVAIPLVLSDVGNDLHIMSGAGIGELVQSVGIVGIVAGIGPGMSYCVRVVLIRHDMEVMRNRRVGEFEVSVVKMHCFDYDLAA